MNTDTQSEKALMSSYFCYFLAFLVMCVTAWFIVEGIQATEPDSPARHAKVAAGVLLLVLEGCVFSLAGQYQKHAFILRLLGWSIFVLQIALMTLANYSVGATAGKAAALSTATVAEIRAQADASRQTAATLRESAAKLNKSKHGWLNEQGGKVSAEAAKQTADGAGAVEKLEKMKTLNVSTPLVETIGTTGLMVLSGALAFILESAGIVLMHVAGSLRHKAQDGQQPVENQILGMLQQMTGAPASPALLAAPAKQEQAPSPVETLVREEQRPAPVLEKPPFGFIPPAHARLDAPESGELWTPPRREFFLSEERKKPEQNTEPTVPKPEHTAPEGVPKSEHNTEPAVLKPEQKKPAESEQPKHVPAVKAKRKTIKTRAAATSSKIDTGTTGKAAGRYNRIKAAVAAGTIRPSVRAIQEVEGGSNEIVMGYQSALVRDGVIKLNESGRGYELVKPADKSQLALEV